MSQLHKRSAGGKVCRSREGEVEFVGCFEVGRVPAYLGAGDVKGFVNTETQEEELDSNAVH